MCGYSLYEFILSSLTVGTCCQSMLQVRHLTQIKLFLRLHPTFIVKRLCYLGLKHCLVLCVLPPAPLSHCPLLFYQILQKIEFICLCFFIMLAKGDNFRFEIKHLNVCASFLQPLSVAQVCEML